MFHYQDNFENQNLKSVAVEENVKITAAFKQHTWSANAFVVFPHGRRAGAQSPPPLPIVDETKYFTV